MAMIRNDGEHQHQKAFFTLVEMQLLKRFPFLDRLLFAVPNGGKRSLTAGGKQKAEGLTKGVSDIILLRQGRGYNYLCIEMKFGKNKQSPEQKEFEGRVNEKREGYYYLAYSSQEAMKVLKWYLSDV